MRRLIVIALLLLGATAVLGAAGASGGSGPTCFGKKATIVGSGLINGTSGDDVIVGSAVADVINAGDGNDRVCGLEGNDSLRGELGDDRADGGPGNDRILGHVGTLEGDLTADGGNDSKTIKRGRVISQKPRFGAVLPGGGKVDLVVSRGRTP